MALLSLTSASDARAGILAGGASEVTQVLNKVELIMQTKKIVDQVRQTKQTLQLLKNNFQRLNPASWGQFTGALNLLADSVKQGERTAFSLARADEEYERRFALASGSRGAARPIQPRLPRLVDRRTALRCATSSRRWG